MNSLESEMHMELEGQVVGMLAEALGILGMPATQYIAVTIDRYVLVLREEKTLVLT